MLCPDPTIGDTRWFSHARFGLFIHWGLYALGARHEWLKMHEEMSDEGYRSYFQAFRPDLFDPRAWARAAREAGMKYVVVAAKHHDGFCLWDTRFTPYKATNTPADRDLLGEIIEAFRVEGLRIGIYYSLLDWHHRDFPIDHLHPQRNHPNAVQMNEGRSIARYAEYTRNQVRELLTNYGPVDILWFDYSYPAGDVEEYPQFRGKGHLDWESEKLLAVVRKLSPNTVVNNRLDLPRQFADFYTPEQYQPLEWPRVDGTPVVWEVNHTFSGSFGYDRDETTWKSAGQLIRLLVDSVSKGGNMLLNVGPTGRGVFDQRAREGLQVYVDWMQFNARSIYGCTQSEFQAPTDMRYTQNFETGRLYVHLFAYPFKYVHLPGLAARVEYAQFLHDASEIRLRRHGKHFQHLFIQEGMLTLELPVQAPDIEVPVIELFLKQ